MTELWFLIKLRMFFHRISGKKLAIACFASAIGLVFWAIVAQNTVRYSVNGVWCGLEYSHVVSRQGEPSSFEMNPLTAFYPKDSSVTEVGFCDHGRVSYVTGNQFEASPLRVLAAGASQNECARLMSDLGFREEFIGRVRRYSSANYVLELKFEDQRLHQVSLSLSKRCGAFERFISLVKAKLNFF